VLDAPPKLLSSVCGYCAVGCNLVAQGRQGSIPSLAPDAWYPVNAGLACSKGYESLAPLRADDRALVPLVRDEATGTMAPTSWEGAIATMVERLRAIQARHGADAIAFLSSGQLVSEEMALLGVLAKLGMGMQHGDANTRQCMATSVVAYRESFGFDAPPYAFCDLDESDVIVLWGSNLCVAQPVLWERVRRSRRSPVVVAVDPRATQTAGQATHHFALRPKSDLVLLHALANVLIDNEWIDQPFLDAHVSGLEELRRQVRPFTLERAAAATGLPAERITTLAELLRPGRAVSLWWTMGVNQSHEGTRTAQAIINLALLGGHIGRPGTGANSFTGQCNAMGSRLFSNTVSLLGGHEFADRAHRRKVARVLDVDVARIPTGPGMPYDQIVQAVDQGRIKALWIIGTNPAHSWPDQAAFHRAVAKLDLLVVQDMYHSTETARLAHLVLPAASWGEKDGTFINSERRVGVVRRMVAPPGEALPDFDIFRRVAEAWGCGDLVRGFTSPEAAFEICKRLTAGQPCDITGIEGYEMISRAGGIQWPLRAGEPFPARERRLFEDGQFHHPDGRARLVFGAPAVPPEVPSDSYPFVLLTGRGTVGQWHTLTRTGKAPALRNQSPAEPYVEIAAIDARALGIAPRAWVNVTSRRGSIQVRAVVTNVMRPRQVFIPMHFDVVNRLTLAAFDPLSGQPTYKACAVAVAPVV
jgi:assimilatory nitrate reductase catalytic subunit